MCEVRKFLDRIYICSISQQLLLYRHIRMFLNYWFPGQEYLLAFVSSWKEAEPHICMRSCNTSIFFSWKLFSEHPFYETALSIFIVSSNRLEQIPATLSWNIGAHTFVNCYENNHVDRGGITAGLSQLADHQGQNSIETYTDNYYRRYTTKEHTNYQQLPKEGENGQS